MNDRILSESDWKKFAKSGTYKDAAFIKALAALASGKTPEARLAALDEMEKQAEVLRKANKADKALGAHLDELGKAAGRERRLQQAEAMQAAAPNRSDQSAASTLSTASSGFEDDSPASLTTKMLPLLRLVKQGEPMKALIAVAGNEAAVMVSRRSASTAQRKLMTDYLEVSGGVKFVAGDCLWEENAVTFVLQSPAGGLARKIAAALLKQIEQRIKVRVRGEDGVVDASGGDGDTRHDIDARPTSDAPASQAASPTASPTASVSQVVLTQIRLIWGKALKSATAELDALNRAIVDAARDDVRARSLAADLASLSARFESLKVTLNGPLIDRLDEALNAADAETRRRLHREAAVVARRYQAALAVDPLMPHLEGNPFTPVKVVPTLHGVLDTLAVKLAA
jgi:hypothetical protein